MAANLKSRGITSFGKRLVNQIRATTTQLSPPSASALTSRRATHVSTYEKNPDDQTPASLVPDDVICPQSDKYWAPHPQTGVFGPDAEHSSAASGEMGFQSSSAEVSVLEEKTFFRHTNIEDLEKASPTLQ